MSGQIVTREQIRVMARRAFRDGRSRDSHAMHWGAPALLTWLAEYDHLAAQAAADKLHEGRAPC